MPPRKKIPVTFNGVSYGKEACSLGIKVSRGHMDLEAADKNFTNRIIGCAAECDPNCKEDEDGQLVMGDQMIGIEFEASVAGFGVKQDYVTASLKIPKGDVDPKQVVKFAGVPGFLHLGRSRKATEE